MPSDLILAASPQQVNVLVVIDTEYVKKNYPNPSKDQNHPTGINHSSQFMICTGSRGIISGQGTADLNFRANVGDTVAFTGVSIYDNADDAVIIYGIQYWKRDNVFNQFVPDLVTRTGAVIPNSDSPNGLPAVQVKTNFSSFDSKVKNAGTEDFYVLFALYTLSDNGENQNLFGYYYWDPTITVA
ncbi:inclusion body family protein [Collimonas arenae]|uniref:Inclusion body family protein n=1 Tax=Collimonas arenae TaxID=279058 RepID=A0A127QID5_9BURK|nr:inclusion body family protein [Collimonas arenae]AMO99935.1 inclusion body family protein [Collimonas arenae]AMP09831.1 inclusion body family protein [Collimonas arenae]